MPYWKDPLTDDEDSDASSYCSNDPPHKGLVTDSDTDCQSDGESESEEGLFAPVAHPPGAFVAADTTFAYDLSCSESIVKQLGLPTECEVLDEKRIDQVIKNCRQFLAGYGEYPKCYKDYTQLPKPTGWSFERFTRKGKVPSKLELTKDSY